jgi:hypothetical protein
MTRWIAVICLAAALGLQALPGQAGPSAASPEVETLLARAKAAELAEAPAWLALGHYRPDLIGPGHHSLIDSAAFFLAADGKTDPEAELEATLRAVLAPLAAGADPNHHPQCRFVARYRWLRMALDLDPAGYAEIDCPRFDEWAATIGAEQVTLIFPAAYFNNPASMFGHTLLRLDRPNQTEETQLLSYAVNYGADTGTDNGLLFAVYGLTGFYHGTYSVEPYYQLVKRYRDIESRDIWEYQLDLTPAETGRLVEHLWELQGHYADYYFFDENCAYQLLFLLDVARPGLDLAGTFAIHVIPVDSVRAVLERGGLLKEVIFRPSARTSIEHRLAALADDERALVDDLAAGRIGPEAAALDALPPARRAAVLELAGDFVGLQMRSGQIARDIAAKRSWEVLAARSRSDALADLPPVPRPATRPDQGHGSARLGLGLGRHDGRWFQALRFRPAYHDQTDPSGGYVPGAAIDFMDLELRHYEDGDALELEGLTGVGIRSLTPRNRLIQPLSWKLRFGLERFRVEGSGEEGALVGVIEGGAGPSWALGRRAILSTTLDAGITAGEDCEASCSFNAGPALALTFAQDDRATLALESRAQVRLGEKTRGRYEVKAGQSFGLGADLSLKLEGGIEDEGQGLQALWLASLNWYF